MIRPLFATGLGLLLAPPLVAQTAAEMPQIVLPGSSQAAPAPAAPPVPAGAAAPGPGAPVAAVPVTPEPTISLPGGDASAAGAGAAQAGAADAPAAGTPVTGSPAEPVAAAPEAVDPALVIPLQAAAGTPTEVRIGAGLSAPEVLRLTGEQATAGMVLTLPDGPDLPQALTLTLRSSVNVDPDRAALSLRINQGEPLAVPVGAMDYAPATLAVTGLRPGRNELLLTAVQPHRIFCGPDASFGTWSEIDLAASGAALSLSQLPVSPDGFFAALRAQLASGGPVQILAQPGTPDPLLREVASAVRLRLGPQAVGFAVHDFYSADSAALARIAIVASDRAAVTTRQGANGGLVLQIETLNGALPDLDAALPAPGAPAPPAPQLAPGEAVSLAALGVPEIVADTHYFRRDVPFRLPEDWLLMANQRSKLTLHYGYAQALPEGALLLVKVNGTTVRLLPLDVDGGKLQPPLTIQFRANLLRPGLNALGFEVVIPGDPPDAICQVRSGDMLAILGDSTLMVPDSPRMKLAGLGPALAGLDQNAVGLPQALTRQDISGLLPFTSLIRPISGGDPGARLTLVSAERAELVPLATPGLTVRDLQSVLVAGTSAQAAGLAAAAAPPPPEADRFAPPIQGVKGPWTAIKESLARRFSVESWTARQTSSIEDAIDFASGQSLPDWLEGKSGQAVLLRPDPASPADLWLILAPEARPVAVAQALEDFRHSGLARGEAAVLQQDGTWLVWSAYAAPDLLEPVRAGNVRAVLGNYASWSPALFAAVMLALALISVIPALLFVRMTRRRESGK